MRILIIVALMTFYSCATGVRIHSKYCHSKGLWSAQRLDEETARVFKKRYFSFGVREISLKEIFEEERVHCEDIKELSVEIERSFLDSVFYLIPGISSQKIKVLYK